MGDLRDIRPEEFTTLEEFDEAIEFVDEECGHIEMQINSARGAAAQYGEYSDSDWYARATLALRLARSKKQKLAKKRAALAIMLKEQKHRERDLNRERIFINLCRDELPREQYLSLWKRVDELENATRESAENV